MKSQISNYKQNSMTKIPIKETKRKKKCLGYLVILICDLFEICYLYFVILPYFLIAALLRCVISDRPKDGLNLRPI